MTHSNLTNHARPIHMEPVVLLAALLFSVAGCASFKPQPLSSVPFRERALRSEDAEYVVEVAVPSAAEAARIFSRSLDKKDIQPVWIRIRNRGEKPGLFMPRALDAQYYSPLEVAYQYRSLFTPSRNKQMGAFLVTNSMPIQIPPGETRFGFVFAHFDQGSKHVNVALVNDNGLKRFRFTPQIPGLKADWQTKDWESLSRNVEATECDEVRLRTELEKLPRAVTDKAGKKEGDPLNLVVIANPDDLETFIWSGWDETERITGGSAWRTFKSFLVGTKYRYSPISSLYVFGRPQEVALQKARGSVHLRNHLRLWLTPFRFQGKNVWIGQISRDIGVYFTGKLPSFTTHAIDADVDETRDYLIQDLALSQGLRRYGYVKGVGPVSIDAPRRNLSGDPYFTDGFRAVLELTTNPTDLAEIQVLNWE